MKTLEEEQPACSSPLNALSVVYGIGMRPPIGLSLVKYKSVSWSSTSVCMRRDARVFLCKSVGLRTRVGLLASFQCVVVSEPLVDSTITGNRNARLVGIEIDGPKSGRYGIFIPATSQDINSFH